MSILMKLEVAKKQAYIFASQKLVENATASKQISYVTSSAYFEEIASNLYEEGENLIYAGGGHCVLQFATKEQAVDFAKQVTGHTLGSFEGLELFCATLAYDDSKNPSENLRELSKTLEQKKSLGQSKFRLHGIGVEALSKETWKPFSIKNTQKSAVDALGSLDDGLVPLGNEFAHDFSDITGGEGFISVVHIDGNAMGVRIGNVYTKHKNSTFDQLRQDLQAFSLGVQENFEEAFHEMTLEFLHLRPEYENKTLPIRPVILAGDDVCFVTSGSLGLELSRIFMEKLSKIANPVDGKTYASCAGVCIVHQKYPFYKAYEMAEQLCDSAKKQGVLFHETGSLSLIDWHIEYGQLKEELQGEIRDVDYRCEDGKHLALRPYVVVNPEKIDVSPYKKYDFFRSMMDYMQQNESLSQEELHLIGDDKLARGKLKNLRTALKQGETETVFYLENNSLNDLLYWALKAKEPESELERAFMQMKQEGRLHKISFDYLDEQQEKHCIYFDSMEMLDIFLGLKEEST